MAKKYTDQDRLNALELIKGGHSITAVGITLNIPRTTVSTWHRAAQSSSVTSDERDESSSVTTSDEIYQLRVRVDQLEKQIQELRQSIDPKLQWVDRKMRTEQKQRDQESQLDPKPRWQPGLKK